MSDTTGYAANRMLEWLNPALQAATKEIAEIEAQLAAAGEPVVGQTTPEFGYQLPRLDDQPPTPSWVQVDLGAVHSIDWLALMPAQLSLQVAERRAHAFPRRFRIDVSDNPTFETSTALAAFTETDFPDPGIAPASVRAGGRRARYVRLTVTKLALENGQHFFALAELMVISGPRNIALGRPGASASINLPPRWAVTNLVDGRTPLGPPVRRELLPNDGIYAGMPAGGGPAWMKIDLGEFGRTPFIQGSVNDRKNWGRDHHPYAFTTWMAGGGVKPGYTHGETDDLGVNVVRDAVHVHDLQATVLHLLGIDHTRLTYRFQGRDFRMTDVHGNVVKELIA